MIQNGSIHAGDKLTISNPYKYDGVHLFIPSLLEITAKAPCTYVVDYPDGDISNGGVMVTVSFYVPRNERKIHRLKHWIEELRRGGRVK